MPSRLASTIRHPALAPVSNLVLAAVALLMLTFPSAVHAQARFALELDLGGQLALSPSRHGLVALDVDSGAGDTAVGTPRLSNWTNTPGLHLGVTALVSTMEVRYRFEGFGWRGERPLCVGDRLATELPTGEVDDAEVRYNCQTGDRVDLADSTRALRMHHLSAGPRFYLRRRPRVVVRDGLTVERERTQLYAIPFLGVTLARYEDPHLGPRVGGGFHVGAGAGAEFPLERRISLVADLRYTASFVSAAASAQARARRAIATGRGPFGALFDGFHRVGANIGVRFDFR